MNIELQKFCSYCEEFVQVKIIESKEVQCDFGRYMNYMKLEGVCPRCGRRIYCDEIEEINFERQSRIE